MYSGGGPANTVLEIQGPIENGLFDRIVLTIAENDRELPDVVWVQSPGGDLEEAMKIGRFLRNSFSVVRPQRPSDKQENYCDSACAIIVLASRSYEDSDDVIGLHRPYFSPSQYSGLSLSQAKNSYKSLEHAFYQYLIDMGIKERIVDRIMATSSDQIWSVTMSELLEMNGQPPYVEEWIKAQCPANLSKDGWDQYSAMATYDGLLYFLKDCPEFFLRDQLSNNAEFILNGPSDPSACGMVDFYLEKFKSSGGFDSELREVIGEKVESYFGCTGEVKKRARAEFRSSEHFPSALK